jgi:hypothetical protein
MLINTIGILYGDSPPVSLALLEGDERRGSKAGEEEVETPRLAAGVLGQLFPRYGSSHASAA